MIEFLIVGTLAILAFTCVIESVFFREFDPLSPIKVLVAAYIVYNLIAYVRPETYGISGAEDQAACAIIGAMGILLGTMIGVGEPIRFPKSASVPLSDRRLLTVGIIITTISLLLIFVTYALLGLSIRTLLTGTSMERASETNGYISTGFMFLPLGAMFLALWARNRSVFMFVVVIVVSILLSYFIFRLAARRSVLIHVALAIICILHYNHKQFRVFMIVVAAAVLVVVLQYLNIQRWEFGRVHNAGYDVAVDNQMRLEGTEFYKMNMLSFKFFDEGEQVFPADEGLDYFGSLANIPPQFIAKDFRGTTLTQLAVETYNPKMARAGGGLAFSALYESYYNLSYLGPFVYFGLWSYVISSLYVVARRSPHSSTARIMVCMLIPVLFYMMRTQFYGFFKGYIIIQFSLTLFVIYLAFKFIRSSPQELTRTREIQDAGRQGKVLAKV
jgi:hypothetical protein